MGWITRWTTLSESVGVVLSTKSKGLSIKVFHQRCLYTRRIVNSYIVTAYPLDIVCRPVAVVSTLLLPRIFVLVPLSIETQLCASIRCFDGLSTFELWTSLLTAHTLYYYRVGCPPAYWWLTHLLPCPFNHWVDRLLTQLLLTNWMVKQRNSAACSLIHDKLV